MMPLPSNGNSEKPNNVTPQIERQIRNLGVATQPNPNTNTPAPCLQYDSKVTSPTKTENWQEDHYWQEDSKHWGIWSTLCSTVTDLSKSLEGKKTTEAKSITASRNTAELCLWKWLLYSYLRVQTWMCWPRQQAAKNRTPQKAFLSCMSNQVS